MSDVEEILLRSVGGRERFINSFNGRSHFPDRVATRHLSDAISLYDAGSKVLAESCLGAEAATLWQARFVKLWSAYQHAGARVMNWFITGPANFPVARNEKRMEIERRRWDEFWSHANGAAEFARRRARSAERAALSAVAAEVEHKDRAFTGGRLVFNTTLDRVQLVFDGKPDQATIGELKGRAFRWSPREGAWQRQLTRNGVWAAEAVIKSISEEA